MVMTRAEAQLILPRFRESGNGQKDFGKKTQKNWGKNFHQQPLTMMQKKLIWTCCRRRFWRGFETLDLKMQWP